jgi:hypothetical protein
VGLNKDTAERKKTMSGVNEPGQLSPEGLRKPPREPMTSAQASCLKMLADEAQEPSAFDKTLSKMEASRRISVLTERLRIGHLPPHTD